jgi:hypothetical protein
MGGPSSGGDSGGARKAYLHAIHQVGAKRGRTEQVPDLDLVFGKKDLDGVILPHDDALVATIIAVDAEISRVLIDGGSAVDVLVMRAFEALGLPLGSLEVCQTPFDQFFRRAGDPERSYFSIYNVRNTTTASHCSCIFYGSRS